MIDREHVFGLRNEAGEDAGGDAAAAAASTEGFRGRAECAGRIEGG